MRRRSRMAGKAHAEEIEDFALVPFGRRPDRGHRFELRVAAVDAHPQAHGLARRNREQVIVHLKTRLEREAVHGGKVAQKVELQPRFRLQKSAHTPQMLARHDQCDLAAELDGVGQRRRHPRRAPVRRCLARRGWADRSQAALPARCRARPIERALLPEIYVPGQQDGDVDEHLEEAKPA